MTLFLSLCALGLLACAGVVDIRADRQATRCGEGLIVPVLADCFYFGACVFLILAALSADWTTGA